jgi:tRNA 2-thiouridine synthesizing protein D
MRLYHLKHVPWLHSTNEIFSLPVMYYFAPQHLAAGVAFLLALFLWRNVRASHFIKAALAMNHQIFRVFFYQDGIYHALRYATPPEDEFQMTQKWHELAHEHHIDLVVCISAGQKRGLLCSDEAKRQNKTDDDLAEGFRISGLGQLVEATLVSDRFIVFG